MKFGLLTFCALVFAAPTSAVTSVWKVTDGIHHLYLGGTIHVLSDSDYPLPEEFDQAFNGSQQVVLETDFGVLQSSEFQTAFFKALAYPEGQNLRQKLSEETYQLLKAYVDKRGMSMRTLMGYKPGMTLTTLAMIELQRMGVTATGVDQYYHKRAKDSGKLLGQLETVDEQLSYVAGMGIGIEDNFIIYTMQDINEFPKVFAVTRKAWRLGNTDLFNKEIILPWKKEFPKVYNSLVVKRNNAWLPKIEAMLKTKDVEMVLVGTLHLIGQDGLLHRLSEKGYKLKQL